MIVRAHGTPPLLLGVLAALAFGPNTAWAVTVHPVGNADCPNETGEQASAPMPVENIRELRKALTTATGHSTLFDATYLFHARDATEGTTVEGFSIPAIFKNDVAGLTQASSVASSSFSSSSFNQSMKYLAAQKDSLSTQQRLLVLSLIGSRLSAGYSANGDNVTDLEKVFQNAKLSGVKGGICGDIHAYLAEAAKALGFESAGLHSGLWQKAPKNSDAEGHYVSYFRDPKTGEYYSQNYSQIVRTGKKDVQGAVDVSTRILGPLTGVSYVQSLPGRWHLYVPQTARWVENEIKVASDLNGRSEGSALKLQASNEGLYLGAGIKRQLSPETAVNLFYVHSDRAVEDGQFTLDAVGISTNTQKLYALEDSVIDELGFFSRGRVGLLSLSAPVYRPAAGTTADGQRTNLFMGGELKGTARIKNSTGRVELSFETLDFLPGTVNNGSNTTGSRIEGKLGIDQKLSEHLSATIERSIQMVPKSAEKVDPGMKTAYDRIGIIVDTRAKEEKFYIRAGGSVYALEGIDKTGATGLLAQIKAAIDAGKVGEFSVVTDVSTLVNNPAKDPYFEPYKRHLAGSHSVQWSKWWNRNVQTGAGVRVENRKHFPIFPTAGDHSPRLEDVDRKAVTGFVWIRSVF